MELSERDKELIIDCIERGESLPSRFRQTLFDDPLTVELIWPGKTTEVENVVLPFQSIEQIDEPRDEQEVQLDFFSLDKTSGRQKGGWSNKLIWGDNKLILSSLANGHIRSEIEDAGGLKLVYIDPPFDVGADFSFDVEVGEESVTKSPSVIEEVAYRDTWGDGTDSYANMIYERIHLIQSLMSEHSYFIVHCDWHVQHILRCILDDIFGSEHFVNEIIWHYYNKYSAAKTAFPRSHDNIYVYRKGESRIINEVREDRDAPVRQLQRENIEGKLKNKRDETGAILYQEVTDRKVDDVWRIPAMQPASSEWTGYDTQKHHDLLHRIIIAFSSTNDLVADFFCGSGTTLAVAEKLGRKWIGSDLSRFAIHTSRKRLIGVQRELKNQNKPYRSFEILNLGKYERQYLIGIDMSQPEEARKAQSELKEEQYLELILTAYSAQRSNQSAPFHGFNGSTAVLVGAIDSPITRSTVQSAVKAAKNMNILKVDILGFEFEMGIKPALQDEAREEGVTLSLKYIPNDVFDKRAIDKGQVKFYDVAYVEAKIERMKLSVTVKLTDFGVFYRQEDADRVAAQLKNGKSKVTVDKGQIVKISKDKDGKISQEVLTQVWSDWIDYWAVDFNYGTKQELIRVREGEVEKQEWTGGFIFQNEWQSYRTRRNRSLELTSAPHEYSEPGSYKVAIKVIDIFGNDTTKVIPVKVS